MSSLDDRLLFKKSPAGLLPFEERAEDWHRRLKYGAAVAIEKPRLVRNPRHHRLYWALVGLVWQNVDNAVFPTQDALHEALKIEAGLRTRIVTLDGEVGYIAGSIAWHRLGQTEFAEFYEKVSDIVAEKVIPGLSSEALRREVAQMVGAV